MKLIGDEPLKEIADDEFGRDKLVELICKSIVESEEENHLCRCIGIYGEWGSGKTTMMNFVESELKK